MILVAGIGNIFLGDDAFGCEVVKVLAARDIADKVRLFDYGIRGLDLMFALLEDPELVILIDATPQGGVPGTVYAMEPEPDDSDSGDLLAGHNMNPMKVLRAARDLGAKPGRVVLIGCEPADLGGEDGRMGLTAPVAAAVSQAADMVETLIRNQFLEVTA